MKKLLLIPILLVAALASNAQDIKKENRRPRQTMVQKTPEQRAEMSAKRMAEQLSLTKEQQEKVYQLSLKQAKKSQALAQAMKALKNDNQKSRQEIENILTPEQQKKWTELKSQQRKSRKGKIDSQKGNFKHKPGMIKKPDSIQSRRPAKKITPIMNKE